MPGGRCRARPPPRPPGESSFSRRGAAPTKPPAGPAPRRRCGWGPGPRRSWGRPPPAPPAAETRNGTDRPLRPLAPAGQDHAPDRRPGQPAPQGVAQKPCRAGGKPRAGQSCQGRPAGPAKQRRVGSAGGASSGRRRTSVSPSSSIALHNPKIALSLLGPGNKKKGGHPTTLNVTSRAEALSRSPAFGGPSGIRRDVQRARRLSWPDRTVTPYGLSTPTVMQEPAGHCVLTVGQNVGSPEYPYTGSPQSGRSWAS